jgi:hypothetical protein
MKHAPILFAVAAFLITAAGTAGAQLPPENLVACARLPDPAARLHCYDTQMTAMGVVVAAPPAAPLAPALPTPASPNTAPAPAVASAGAPPAAVAPQGKFGEEDLRQAARPKEEKADKVMESVITSIHEARPKLYIIVLANGQIWMQEGTQMTYFFRVGYNARIEKGFLGDYRMSTHETGDKNMVKVTRIQ